MGGDALAAGGDVARHGGGAGGGQVPGDRRLQLHRGAPERAQEDGESDAHGQPGRVPPLPRPEGAPRLLPGRGHRATGDHSHVMSATNISYF